jgi:hypothetical protein
MIDQNYLKQIIKILDLEKISVLETVTLLCFPKKVDDDFKKKFEEIEKKIPKKVMLKYVSEGEIENDCIEIQSTSNVNGTS